MFLPFSFPPNVEGQGKGFQWCLFRNFQSPIEFYAIVLGNLLKLLGKSLQRYIKAANK